MSRTPNRKRPEQLRNAILEYVLQHGLTGLSLRPLAKAVGSSPRVLLYYFGSKEKMVVELLAELRRRQMAVYSDVPVTSFAEACQTIWKHMSTSASLPTFRLFFEAYGMALRQRRLYKAFLHSTIEDWLRAIAEPLQQEGYDRRQARAFATVLLAGLRGFMLDYCTTRDRKRLDHAASLWLGSLDSMLVKKREV